MWERAMVIWFSFKVYLECHFSCMKCTKGNEETDCDDCGDNSIYHRTLQSDNKCKCDDNYYSIDNL